MKGVRGGGGKASYGSFCDCRWGVPLVYSAGAMRLFRPIRWVLFLLLLVAVAGAVRLWRYVDELTEPVLTPMNQSYAGYTTIPQKAPGLRLEPFSFRGWDGGEVPAVLAVKEGEESSRQLSVMGDLTVRKAERLNQIDYVLLCVDWDHGIRSALPLAESLTAAGLTCVLWEPRGSNDRRPYCTHGLKESTDVPLLLNALVERSGKENPVIVGVGQGFGAGLLLQAAVREPRLRGLVAIDAYASLRESLDRTMPSSLPSFLTLWLMDLKISSAVGFECFDVAPVESAARIDRNVPVLVVNLVQDNPVSTLKDALTIYRQLPSDCRDVWTLRSPEDSPEAETREFSFSVGADEKRRKVVVPVGLIKDEDSAPAAIVHWLNDRFVEAIETPHVVVPARPVLSSDSHL